MSELAPPLHRTLRSIRRLEVLERGFAQVARLQSQLRLELTAFVQEDTMPGFERFVPDELALALAESTGSMQNLLADAQLYAMFPAVIARVGLPLRDGGWSLRHADALLDSLVGLELTAEQQQAVVDLVVASPDASTPYQVRKAAQAAVLILDPEAAARRYERAKKRRRVSSETWSDGSVAFTATGTATQIASVLASLDALAGPKQPGDARTLDQRRFDAFMDLISGRIQPGQWQALIVVPLSTLEGGDEPAEVPGLGLISAQEARDVLATAEFRRAVVDENGTLASVDSRVHRPDLPQVAKPEPHPDRRLSLESEAVPLDLTPEHTPTSEDLTWFDQQLDQAQVVTLALSTLERELTELLATVPRHAFAGSTPLVVEAPGWTHGHQDPGSPGGPGGLGNGPPDPPQNEPEGDPDPEPPSFDDLHWHETTQDRAAQDAQEPPPTYEREPDSPDTGQAGRSSAWTLLALTRAQGKLRTAGVEPAPTASASYFLPVPMARFIKHRDLTCTFPGCRRLARDCQNDHLDAWPIGPTTVHNTSSECVHHHQAKHAYFTVKRTGTGALTWTTPLGRSYTRHPRPLLRGW